MNDKANVVKLTKVRLSYPHLFRRASFEGEEGKFEATFIIKKDDPQIGMLKKHIAEIRKGLNFKVPSDKLCIKDGDETDKPELQGCYTLKASTNRRPVVINRDKTPLVEDDNIIYGGCYVNATVDFWVQNNKYGKRINSNLRTVQFDSDGEPFGAGPVDDDDMFDELEEASGNDDGDFNEGGDPDEF